MANGSVTVTTSATLVVPPNSKRHSIIITNLSDTVHVYIGQTDSITVADSPILRAKGKLTEDSGATNTYKGPYYAITAADTADVRFWEREQG